MHIGKLTRVIAYPAPIPLDGNPLLGNPGSEHTQGDSFTATLTGQRLPLGRVPKPRPHTAERPTINLFCNNYNQEMETEAPNKEMALYTPSLAEYTEIPFYRQTLLLSFLDSNTDLILSDQPKWISIYPD